MMKRPQGNYGRIGHQLRIGGDPRSGVVQDSSLVGLAAAFGLDAFLRVTDPRSGAQEYSFFSAASMSSSAFSGRSALSND